MNMSDHTLLVTTIIVGFVWMGAAGIWWERNRAGGTRDLRRQRDEARRQVKELCQATVTMTGGHPAPVPTRPRPAAGQRTPQPAARHLHPVGDDAVVITLPARQATP